LQRIKALGDEFDDTGVVEVVPECVVESLKESGVLGIVVGGLEVRDGEEDLVYAKARASAYPILSEGG